MNEFYKIFGRDRLQFKKQRPDFAGGLDLNDIDDLNDTSSCIANSHV